MKRLFVLFALSFFLVLGFSRAAHAATPFGDVCQEQTSNGSGSASNSTVCSSVNNRTDTQTNNPITGSGGILSKAVNILAFLTGVASIIIIIIAGIKYITSTGDPGKVSSAKDTILYAVVGLVVSVTARAIILFIVNRVK
jgi:Type IV secretion system pilin